jgi:hypothetical protein
MKKYKFLLIIFCLAILNKGICQVSFSNTNCNLTNKSTSTGSDIFCTGAAFSLEFKVNSASQKVGDNFLLVDSQVIQILTLKIDGLKNTPDELSEQEQHNLLANYSEYELAYLTKDLKIGVINPNNQWVDENSRKWLVWYFRVDNKNVEADKKVAIQLFASTIIGNKILDINAPIIVDGDFSKAALLVNQFMESLTDNTK